VRPSQSCPTNKFSMTSVFVLMPFARKFNDRYSAIKRAVRDAEMQVERVDEQSFNRQGITDRIIQQIQDADILIADMSTNNLNVFYEVGYAHAKNKLCVLLTRDPTTIPFDLKNRRHIVFSGLNDLRAKLLSELKALKVEAELFFDITDRECFATVPVHLIKTEIVGASQATSIRAKVKTGSEIDQRNVSAQMIKIERRIEAERWKRFKLEQPIQLTWTDTDTILTDFLGCAAKYVNVFHVDHNENQLTIWKVPMPSALSAFLNQCATYRVTISVMGRQIQVDIIWRGHWNTMTARPTKRRVRSRR
jgi:nucleoside 2-deoxyribosyltransferase